MDIYDYLKKDHDKVNALFKQFKKSPAVRKQAIADMIAMELIVHAKSEQETFYKALEGREEGQKEVLHGWEEHGEILDQIDAFYSKKISPKSLEGKINELEKLVKHHVREEEGEIFKKAKKILSAQQAYALKELMHDLKHQYLLKMQG